jgi:hypothetical protein
MNESFYGEAFIPPAYAQRRYSGRFDVISTAFDPIRYDQRILVLRKR